MAVVVSKDKVPAMRRMFSLMDRDGSGKISVDELKDILCSQGYYPSDSELEEMMGEIDSDHSGEIDFEEFVSYCVRRRMSRTISQENREIKDAFNFIDKNGDGFITALEIKQVVREMGRDISEEQAEQMLAEVDKEGEGRMTYQRFKSMMLNDEIDGSIKTTECNIVAS